MEMLHGGEETRAQRILMALEDMTKPELVVLCQNLEKTIQNKEDDINRINSHYEHLLSLYYEAEERLALLNQELFLCRAQSQTNYEWNSGLSTGESINGFDTMVQIDERNHDKKPSEAPGSGNGGKPPASQSKQKRKSSSSRNRQSCDFLSKTMTPVLHRRQNPSTQENRNNNVCAKSTPHGLSQSDSSHKMYRGVSSSWVESYDSEKRVNGQGGDDHEDAGAPREEQQFSEEEADEEEVDLGITINDNLNILTINHGSPPPIQRARFDMEEDGPALLQEETPRSRKISARVATPFCAERPHTAETAGSDPDGGSRPATGERRTPPGEGLTRAQTLVLSRDDLAVDEESVKTRGENVSWSLNITDKSPTGRRSRQDRSPSRSPLPGKSPNRGGKSPRMSKRSDERGRGKDGSCVHKSLPVSKRSKDANHARNENRNSHNNNIPNPELSSGSSSPSLRSVAVGYGDGEFTEYSNCKSTTPRNRKSVYGSMNDRGTSPAQAAPLDSQRSYSLDSLAASQNYAKSSSIVSPRGRMIITDELDQVYRTNKMKIRHNTGAVFGSYESIQRAVSADESRGRYPGLIPHAPNKPKRPHTATASGFSRQRSKSLTACKTYPPISARDGSSSPGNSSTGETQGKPPSGMGHFDVSRLRQRNRAAVAGKYSPRRPQERSPSPLTIRAIVRPTSLSTDSTKAADYSLTNSRSRSSIDGLKTRAVPERNRSQVSEL